MSAGPGINQNRILAALEASPGVKLPVADILTALGDVEPSNVYRALRSLESGGRVSRLSDDEAGAVYRLDDALAKMLRNTTAEQWDELSGPTSLNPGVPPISWEELEDEGEDQDEDREDLAALEMPESDTPCTTGQPMHDLSDMKVRLSDLTWDWDTP